MNKLFKKSLPTIGTVNLKVKKSQNGELSSRISGLKEKYANSKIKKTSYLMGLVDATGSMNPVWEETKGLISELIRRVSELGDFEMNWVAFRDYDLGEKLLEYSGWHATAGPLIKFVDNIECIVNSTPEEAVEKGLEFAADDDKCTRVILIGDSPPHKNKGYEKQAMRLAEQGRRVYAFVINGYSETVRTFTQISEITGGSCHTLSSVDEILACVAIAAAEDIGGRRAVESLLKKFEKERKGLPQGAKQFANKLLNHPK